MKHYDLYVRRRWNGWLKPLVSASRLSAYGLALSIAEASGNAKSAKGYASRVNKWLTGEGEMRPEPDMVFRAGEALRSLANRNQQANGVVALYAAGYYSELIDLFAQLSRDDVGRHAVVLFVVTLPIMLAKLDGITLDRDLVQRAKALYERGTNTLYYGNPQTVIAAWRLVLDHTPWPTNAVESAILHTASQAAEAVRFCAPGIAAQLSWLALAEWIELYAPDQVYLDPRIQLKAHRRPEYIQTYREFLEPYFKAMRRRLYIRNIEPLGLFEYTTVRSRSRAINSTGQSKKRKKT